MDFPTVIENSAIGVLAFVVVAALVSLLRSMVGAGINQMLAAGVRQQAQEERYDALHRQYTDYLTTQARLALEAQYELMRELKSHEERTGERYETLMAAIRGERTRRAVG